MAQIKLYMVHFLYGTDMAQIWDFISGPYLDQIWDLYLAITRIGQI